MSFLVDAALRLGTSDNLAQRHDAFRGRAAKRDRFSNGSHDLKLIRAIAGSVYCDGRLVRARVRVSFPR
jgi:hypothetical protein